MPVYDHEVMLVGNVQEIGLRKSLEGAIQITLKIDNRDKTSETNSDDESYDEITWSDISKIGDIVLINWEQKKYYHLTLLLEIKKYVLHANTIMNQMLFIANNVVKN